MKLALISVSDKTNLAGFAKELISLGYNVISTGGTAKYLLENDIPTINISDVTGFPEILDGRVKTLHPNIHGGILAKRMPEHLAQIKDLNIELIDIVVVNLYPFEKTVEGEHTFEQAIENIDIGGPAMLRSAAKNFEYVIPIVDSADYESVIEKLKINSLTKDDRLELARKVFEHTARYDTLINNYLNHLTNKSLGKVANFSFRKILDLRYGENPHQKAAVYKEFLSKGIVGAKILQGKEMSFNNYLDADAAFGLVNEFSETACVIVKHSNPCGVAVAQNIIEAFNKAKQTDPVSAYGGIVAINREMDYATATEIASTFFEIIIAPKFSEDAKKILSEKKNLRLLETGEFNVGNMIDFKMIDFKRISGGLLLQDKDLHFLDKSNLKFVTEKQPSQSETEDMLFAWKVVKHVKSNAIIFVKNKQTIGIGAGQMSRIDSTELGISKAKKAGLDIKGCVMASDAFFPFRDNVDLAARAGVTSIIQPGGSIRDNEVIGAANEHKIAMAFTGIRSFRH